MSAIGGLSVKEGFGKKVVANSNAVDQKSVSGLKDKVRGLKEDLGGDNNVGVALSLAVDPKIQEQAGFSQIAAVMAFAGAPSRDSNIALGISEKAAIKTEVA